MHKTKATAASSAAKGTPAAARPMPASAACTSAVTTTPSATPRMACAASRTTRSPGSPARRRPKRSSPSAARSPFAYMTAAMASVSRNCTSSQPTPRIVPAIHRMAVAAYGAAADATSARRLAAIFCHASTACVPTTGSVRQPRGRRRHGERPQRRRPVDDRIGVGDDRADGERQRQDQHEQQRRRSSRQRPASGCPTATPAAVA